MEMLQDMGHTVRDTLGDILSTVKTQPLWSVDWHTAWFGQTQRPALAGSETS